LCPAEQGSVKLADTRLGCVEPGKAEVSKRGCDLEKAQVLAEAKEIVKNGWSPSHWMIDKCMAEREAILEGKGQGFASPTSACLHVD
jgi:hypothetical protein